MGRIAKHIDMQKCIAYILRGVGRRRPTLRMSNAIACQSDYSYAVWAFCVCLRAALIPHTLTHFVISTKLHFAVTSGINKFYVSKCLSVRSVRLFFLPFSNHIAPSFEMFV